MDNSNEKLSAIEEAKKEQIAKIQAVIQYAQSIFPDNDILIAVRSGNSVTAINDAECGACLLEHVVSSAIKHGLLHETGQAAFEGMQFEEIESHELNEKVH